MKKTAKLFLFAAMAAVVFSCTKENQVNTDNNFPDGKNSEKVIVPATDGNTLTSFKYTLEGASTKVTVNISNGVTAVENGDEVLVFVASDNKAVYIFDSSNSRFNLKSGETAVELSAPASVFYPANEYEVDGGSVKFIMPAAIEASDDFGAINPMAGVIAGSEGAYEVLLCNLASVLRVQVTADVNINSVKLDYGAGVNYASGAKFTVDASAKTMALSSGSAGTDETVALGTPATSADVLFIIPTLDLANGLTATANLAANHNGGANSFSVTNSATEARLRNKISTMSFYAGLFSGGAGVDGDPYLIANARDFKNLQKYTVDGYTPGSKTAASFLSAYYKQTADIDAGTVTPIGTSSAPFTGEYDGNNNALNNVTIAGTDFAGIFGQISGGSVKNLTIGSGSTISTNASNKGVGGIAGKITSGSISGCTNNADVTCTAASDQSYAGGIVGLVNNLTANVVISNCVNNGAIYGNIFVGGITGSLNAGSYDATIFKCINNAAVTAKASNAGGIAGALYKGTVNLCYGGKGVQSNNYPTGGAIVKAVSRAGGLVGIMNNANAWVLNSSSRAFVWTTGKSDEGYKSAAGGLVGYINTAGGHIVNSVHWNMNVSNTGATSADDATGKIAVGGIVGYIANNNGYVANCYTQRQGNALGCYYIDGSQMKGRCLANNDKGTWIGQIFGYNAGTIVNSYYSTAYTGVGTSTGTDHSAGVSNDVKNGTAAASDINIYTADGSSVNTTKSGYLWEILEAGKSLTGWSGADDMSWTHYTSGSLEVAIPTVILDAGSEFYL